MKDLNIEIELVNQKVQFKTVSDVHPDQPVIMDYVPPLGDNQGFMGLELLLMSFCGCVSTATVFLLRRTGRKVLSFKALATGIRQENPLSLNKIIFKAFIKSNDIDPSDMEKVLNSVSNVSPVWLAIKNNVEVLFEYELLT
jgi:uncharacterized OsmC-like protein